VIILAVAADGTNREIAIGVLILIASITMGVLAAYFAPTSDIAKPWVALAVSNAVIALLELAGIEAAGQMLLWFAIFSTMVTISVVGIS
jgi:hypothetical protein